MSETGKIIIVGTPNVGKSVIFNALTGRYATVSNYPGTTVDVFRGPCKIGGGSYEIIDTPGMYSLVPVTEEERVSRAILMKERAFAVIHVIDAKNLERMLPFTLQLIEAGLPVILVLNIMDEAERLDIKINIKQLSLELGVPVISTVGTINRGIKELKSALEKYVFTPPKKFKLDARIEKYVADIAETFLKKDYSVSKRIVGIWLFQEDREIMDLVKKREPAAFKKIEAAAAALRVKYSKPAGYITAMQRQDLAIKIASKCEESPKKTPFVFGEALSRLTMHPFFGLVILFAVLYFGLYKFVGEFGAGTAVNFIQDDVFGYIIPPFTAFVERVLPWKVWQDLFVHDYGIITLGVRYAFAIILPIVSFFFLIFAIIEDSGYLPRLAMLIDRVFKILGLSGRAVIPMVLGLGCDTMATIVTRILPSRRERIISTLLLALAIPCSAQLGVILALLSKNTAALLIWVGVVALVFFVVGYLSSKLLPGESPVFFMEVPPLRLPKLKNIIIKTYTRLEWYLKEVLPMFILVSVFIWVGQLVGLFNVLIKLVAYPVRWIGLPESTSFSFLIGFFRRDYGAAGLYDMHKQGLFNGNQLVVALVTMTLFLPCVAQFMVMVKERGWKAGLYISLIVLVVAFGTGFLLNEALNILKVTL
ncbi:MAG: ferrous iron transport protein B [Candidatus Firestonebacteria bacterium]